MALFILVNAIALTLLWVVYHYLLYPAFFSPLSKIPNAHPTSSFLPLWIWRKRRIGYETRSVFDAHQRHGPIVRLGPKEVSVTSLDGLRHIYAAGFERDPWYDQFMNYRTRSLFTLLPSKQHSARRRMLSNVWSKSHIYACSDVPVFSSVLLSERLLPMLDVAAQTSSPIDVLVLNKSAAADFMSAYILGLTNSSNFISGDASDRARYFSNWRLKIKDYGHVEATKELEAYYLSMCQAADDFLQMGPAKPAASVPATYPVAYAKLSAEVSKNPSTSLPTASRLETLASEVMDNWVAGQEGIGSTLTYMMYELSKRPDLQAVLRAECLTLCPPLTFPLRSQLAGSPNSASPEKPALTGNNDGSTRLPPLPSPSTIDALPLLHAIVYETLRLYPANRAPQPRRVPAGGATIEGIANIPAGTKVSTNSFCMHRNEEVWPEAETWRPERWMISGEKGQKALDEMKRWFWTFGSGGSMCIGSNYAVMVLKLVAAAVYTRFTTSTVDAENMHQKDFFISEPVAEQLILRFHHASTSETEQAH
ncbi:MAG: hypothetical protein M1816_006375 [Peltula sp. TS41687]|nr:MAG: hypothetical protein M1816_006375 [Peltula sp. TS41687]